MAKRERYRVNLPLEITTKELARFVNAMPIFFNPSPTYPLENLNEEFRRWLVRDDLDLGDDVMDIEPEEPWNDR